MFVLLLDHITVPFEDFVCHGDSIQCDRARGFSIKCIQCQGANQSGFFPTKFIQIRWWSNTSWRGFVFIYLLPAPEGPMMAKTSVKKEGEAVVYELWSSCAHSYLHLKMNLRPHFTFPLTSSRMYRSLSPFPTTKFTGNTRGYECIDSEVRCTAKYIPIALARLHVPSLNLSVELSIPVLRWELCPIALPP